MAAAGRLCTREERPIQFVIVLVFSLFSLSNVDIHTRIGIDMENSRSRLIALHTAPLPFSLSRRPCLVYQQNRIFFPLSLCPFWPFVVLYFLFYIFFFFFFFEPKHTHTQ